MIYVHWIFIVLYVAVIVGIMLTVLMDNRQPAKTIAWVLVLLFVPVVGIVLYIFFGQNTRKMKLISGRSLDQLSKRSMLEFVEQRNLRMPEYFSSLVRLFTNQSLSLPFKDNAVEFYTDGYQFFPALLQAIKGATNHIHLDTYIIADDPLGRLVSDALIAKAREGVEVRLIYDDVGCWRVPERFFDRMRQAGVKVRSFMPVRFPAFTSKVNYRNHRKVCVIDGTQGFIGGMNIALRYVKGLHGGTLPWRDTHMRLRGSVVYALQRAFLVDWYFVDRTLINDHRYYPPMPWHISNDSLAQVVTSSPIAQWPDIMQGYVRILLEAKRYVYMETPYFLPTEPVMFAMRTAALAGVDVRLLIPRRSDAWLIQLASMSYVTETLEAGVKVRLYEKGFNHSKLLVADDQISTCGSTNIDFRSFENNFEANVFFYDRQTALRIKDIYMRDEDCSINFSEARELHHRPYMHRFVESLLRLLSPLL
ncbi:MULTISPECIES: cardiolipin synthase [Prevotellaceae]|uniref:cardiolipin synthase n=1 Tax=Leyella stercorea TaxID=363265 RepID=UPI001F2B327F|nr:MULTISPECIES: cardiolipin synthase [Prevotellaceae]MCF2645078.1 cardiolipin synthase [Leyella stercorea]MCI6129395.1 cardiolipin synthase [Prevotella sp.]MDY4645749.1 cardiolipin synthase [Prevotella sp.]MEE1385530.1 cardiolipin synthase [Prevotella sp.]